MGPEKNQIILVNINRFKEGARVLEDIARFFLQDMNLFSEIKALKQSVKSVKDKAHHKSLFLHTQTSPDIGGEYFTESYSRDSVLDIIHANARRMQESARVLEELSDRMFFKAIRFKSYALHQRIIRALIHNNAQKKLTGIYLLCDGEKYSPEYITDIINSSKIYLCQLRMKNSSPYEIAITAEKIRHLLDPEKLLIINDHLDIALATANGVHLGQSDLPLPLAKKIAPQHFIMGATCHNATEISQALDSGASYISVGCLFETKTKINTTPISVQTFNTLTEQIPIPVCAIGGIHFHNIHSILFKQTHMVALCGAVWDAPDPTQALDDFVSLLECRKAADPIFT